MGIRNTVLTVLCPDAVHRNESANPADDYEVQYLHCPAVLLVHRRLSCVYSGQLTAEQVNKVRPGYVTPNKDR